VTYGLLFGVAAAISYAPACYAGPCSQQVDEMQGKIDAKLAAAAAAGPAGKETTAATMNRQPTPKSIAEAEVKLGDISAKLCRRLKMRWRGRAKPIWLETRSDANRRWSMRKTPSAIKEDLR
jgi:hypothetical protein